MLAHLQRICPGFSEYGKHVGFIFRLNRNIFAMDSTTLQLTLARIDWARHRRRKAAAKCHRAHCTSVGAIARAQIFYPVVF
jgi:hypothetical protein